MADKKQAETTKQSGIKGLYNASWVKPAALITLILAIIGSGVGFYLLRQQAAQPPAPAPANNANIGTEHVIKEPTGELEGAINIFINENEIATAAQLVDVNLAANARDVVWFYTDNPALQQLYANFERTTPGTTPWMMPDPGSTARQVAVMNGNFDCVAIANTELATAIAGITDYASYLCVVAVPPEYGRFSGYLAIWMSRVPSADEQGRLIERMRGFSAQIGAIQ